MVVNGEGIAEGRPQNKGGLVYEVIMDDKLVSSFTLGGPIRIAAASLYSRLLEKLPWLRVGV